ncbi:3-deoxy-D-manno-octulosonic acid kinase [Marinomonas agarivorans]|nr:3-deoxy-D-manno-octulosonic acid kinase [Marinomonas agarivorans]
MQEHQTDNPNTHLFVSDLTIPVTNTWFTPDFWAQHQDEAMPASGRGSVNFVKTQNGRFVIRQYLRGGLVSKFSHDRFFFMGAKRSRPYRELALLNYMQDQKLPAPIPVAGIYHRQGLSYTASIMTHLIPNAKELFHFLMPTEFDCREWPKINWHAIGSTIRRFHDAGIDHVDLNCHNIMLDKDNRIWLIDFDKCQKRPPNKHWQRRNLNRLQRSFNKEALKHSTFQYDEQDWNTLLEGYNG